MGALAEGEAVGVDLAIHKLKWERAITGGRSVGDVLMPWELVVGH